MENMSNKNVIGSSKLPEKPNANASQKHSALFYISASLFDNRRLKHKRQKLADKLNAINEKKAKTELRKRKLAMLQADVTIDLLSDDEDESHCMNSSLTIEENEHQHYLVYPGHFELCKVPNITLIPVQKLPTELSEQKCINRKRKSCQPKRHSQPTIVNNESIVLTDDSDNEDIVTSPSPNNTCEQETSQTLDTSNIAQVDEEVTVTLVPRSSTAGTCQKPISKQLFPMMPDETTVHTVIANRIYELSLTKLREGLASCGVPEFNDNQNKITTRRKKVVNPPANAMPQQAPVSLKLSSDLSISLISDDEDETPQLSVQKLLQQQVHLGVQQLHMPLLMQCNADALQNNIPRTLG